MTYQFREDSLPPLSRSDCTTDADASKVRPTVWDRGIALLALALFSPILVLVTLAIVLGGQKPIFFQERVGHQGRLFWIFKFRTMPDEGWKSARARAQTSRIARARLAVFSRVSAVLRATGLDELPQFANILKGDMQVLGPRPLMVEDFLALPDRRLERCAVLPGITGLAQINGGQDLDSNSKLALDLYLIKHRSPAIAAKIVIRSALRILGGNGATATACAIDLERARDEMAAGRKGPILPAVTHRAGGVRPFARSSSAGTRTRAWSRGELRTARVAPAAPAGDVSR